jgi:hypothetical protein
MGRLLAVFNVSTLERFPQPVTAALRAKALLNFYEIRQGPASRCV